MLNEKTRLSAIFVKYELIGETLFRRLHFKCIMNEENIIIKDYLTIDESADLRIINIYNLQKGEPVSFTVDKDMKVINFHYPHDGREETYARIQQKGMSILKKLKYRRNKNERSE